MPEFDSLNRALHGDFDKLALLYDDFEGFFSYVRAGGKNGTLIMPSFPRTFLRRQHLSHDNASLEAIFKARMEEMIRSLNKDGVVYDPQAAGQAANMTEYRVRGDQDAYFTHMNDYTFAHVGSRGLRDKMQSQE